jgi:hypothetical protein
MLCKNSAAPPFRKGGGELTGEMRGAIRGLANLGRMLELLSVTCLCSSSS